jgi:hypothetical protein
MDYLKLYLKVLSEQSVSYVEEIHLEHKIH